MESFEKHFICLETTLVITAPLLSLPPQLVLDKSLEIHLWREKQDQLTTLVSPSPLQMVFTGFRNSPIRPATLIINTAKPTFI